MRRHGPVAVVVVVVVVAVVVAVVVVSLVPKNNNTSVRVAIIVISKKNELSMEISSFQVGDAKIVPASSVKSLGVFLDSAMPMETHTNATCRREFYEIRKIGRIP